MGPITSSNFPQKQTSPCLLIPEPVHTRIEPCPDKKAHIVFTNMQQKIIATLRMCSTGPSDTISESTSTCVGSPDTFIERPKTPLPPTIQNQILKPSRCLPIPNEFRRSPPIPIPTPSQLRPKPW